MFIDTHCHLDFTDFDNDRNEVIERSRREGIDYLINIGSSLEGSARSVELSRLYDFIYASAGIHPHEADSFDDKALRKIEELASGEKVIAIGEIGLDYFKNYSKAENQRVLFQSLLKLACNLDLPVVIHSRNAQEDTLKILKEIPPKKAVVHCFSGDSDFLSRCIALGFSVSFTCNITYKKAGDLRELVKRVPLERLLLETDCPFLPPEGLRGKRNEPLYVKHLAGEVAGLRQMSVEEVARITSDNAKRFFSLK